MAYVHRRTVVRRSGRAELVGLALVLVAAWLTAWWAGQRVGLDMSGVYRFVSLVGLNEFTRPLPELVGARPGAEAQPTAAPTPMPTYCPAGRQPSFELGMAALKQQLGDTMGAPLECEHPSSANGDTVQQTTTGLATYRRATNTVTFTDGWRHWALTARGLVSWQGADADPPPG